MPDYIEPTSSDFNSAEQVMLDVLSSTYPKTQTKAGSTLRELLVRPLAYIYAWCAANLSRTRTESTVAYLQTSQLTDNPVADAIASNYFVTRRQGTRAKGVLTFTLSVPTMQLDANASVTVGGVAMMIERRTIAMEGVEQGLVGETLYVSMVRVGAQYMANVPVVAQATGRTEIDPGAAVVPGFTQTGLVDVQLTSPVSGGSDTETDAELMRRCRLNTADAGVGSYYGLRKKLSEAPVFVIGLKPVAGEDTPIYRARYNSANVNPGGFVDCYVKTQTQYAVGGVTATAELTGSPARYRAVIAAPDLAGAYGILSIVAGGERVNTYTLEFGTTDAYSTPEGSRLGPNQTMIVEFQLTDSSASTVQVDAQVMYMPGIDDLQAFMDRDENRFIGQDVEVKAAVPVILHIDCVVHADGTLSDEDMTLLKSTMADVVNSQEVGTRTLNFSDLAKACRAALPKAELRLPCTISAEMPLRNGGMDAWYVDTGILDIGAPVNPEYWNPEVCFFSVIPDNIRIETV